MGVKRLVFLQVMCDGEEADWEKIALSHVETFLYYIKWIDVKDEVSKS